MSTPAETTAPSEPMPAPEQTRRPRDWRAAAIDAAIVLGWFLVAGVLGALLWWKVVDLPLNVRIRGGTGMGPDQLVKQVSTDGWFFVIAAVTALVSGAVLMTWRKRDPILTVLLVVAGGALAAYAMTRLGLLLGPDDPVSVLRSQPEGATAPSRLQLQAPGIAWVWAIGGALGCLVVLWATPNRHETDS